MTELRVYAELSSLFRNIEFRAKVHGVECDIYLPEHEIAVEVDGAYWHRDRAENDQKKNEKLHRAGVALYRLREAGLPMITDRDVPYTIPKATYEDVAHLIEKIAEHPTLADDQHIKLAEYLKVGAFANEALFMDLLDRLPDPFPGRSLVETNPELAREWHPTNNGRLTPDAVHGYSNHFAWWQCSVNPKHVWEAVISSRARGAGCPFCAGRKADESNSLAALHPDIALEWHPTKNGALTPSDVVSGAGKRVWWQCKHDPSHEWRTAINNRVYANTGCPICSGRVATQAYNLAHECPDIAREWHPTKNGNLMPSDVTPRSDKKVWWQCSNDPTHVWEAIIGNRARLGRGCPYCAGQRVTPTRNLATIYPDVAKEWHPTKNGDLRPEMVMPKTHKRAWWQCQRNPDHVWQAQVSNRTNGAGCPYCYGQKHSLPIGANNDESK